MENSPTKTLIALYRLPFGTIEKVPEDAVNFPAIPIEIAGKPGEIATGALVKKYKIY